MHKRKRHTAAFKAKVAIEAIKERNTVNELAATHQIHPCQISQWKKELLEKAVSLFERGKRRGTHQEHDLDELHQKIGQQTIEIDWLKKKLNQ